MIDIFLGIKNKLWLLENTVKKTILIIFSKYMLYLSDGRIRFLVGGVPIKIKITYLNSCFANYTLGNTVLMQFWK